MKTFLLFFLLILISHLVSGQSKIVDASVNWQQETISVYLTDTIATSISLQISTTDYESHEVLNQTLTLGTDLPQSNILNIPLTGITAGVYYVNVKVTSSTGIQEMEFQTSN